MWSLLSGSFSPSFLMQKASKWINIVTLWPHDSVHTDLKKKKKNEPLMFLSIRCSKLYSGFIKWQATWKRKSSELIKYRKKWQLINRSLSKQFFRKRQRFSECSLSNVKDFSAFLCFMSFCAWKMLVAAV